MSTEMKLTCSKPIWKEGAKFATGKLLNNRKPITLDITGKLIYVPTHIPPRHSLNRDTWDRPPFAQLSVGVKFEIGQVKILDDLIEIMSEHVKDEDFDAKLPHADGVIFFKLAHDEGRCEVESNYALDFDVLPNPKISVGMDVKVNFSVSGWFLKDGVQKKYGLAFKTNKLKFTTEKLVVPDESVKVLEEPELSHAPKKVKLTISAKDKKILKALNKKD